MSLNSNLFTIVLFTDIKRYSCNIIDDTIGIIQDKYEKLLKADMGALNIEKSNKKITYRIPKIKVNFNVVRII